jgi:hypothetical protein
VYLGSEVRGIRNSKNLHMQIRQITVFLGGNSKNSKFGLQPTVGNPIFLPIDLGKGRPPTQVNL